MDLDGTMSAPAAVDDADALGQADVDALLGDEENSGEEAIAACFRRIGYGYRYRGHRSYSHYGYRSFYNCYRSYHHCYTPVYSYCRQVYHNYAPFYNNYWGCW
jgi:hypothetical protein